MADGVCWSQNRYTAEASNDLFDISQALQVMFKVSQNNPQGLSLQVGCMFPVTIVSHQRRTDEKEHKRHGSHVTAYSHSTRRRMR